MLLRKYKKTERGVVHLSCFSEGVEASYCGEDDKDPEFQRSKIYISEKEKVTCKRCLAAVVSILMKADRWTYGMYLVRKELLMATVLTK